MEKKLLVIMFLFSVLSGFSQDFNINGKVVENESSEPLMGANVRVYKQTDSTFFKGTVSDSLGNFEFSLIPKGSYYLKITFLGFITKMKSGLIVSKNYNVGVIKLKASEVFLDAVEVTSEEKRYENNLDKKIYRVQKDILSSSGSATDVLQNIPSVAVDINGGISLRNTSNITIFINGRPSAMLRRSTAVLKQIPASSIERIEVITNPSAKYRSDGVGGIINIVLKKDSNPGFNGQIAGAVGNESRYNANLNLNYQAGDLNFFGNYGIRHSNGTYLFTDSRDYKTPETGAVKSHYQEKGGSTVDAFSHYLYAGANYDINDYNSVELSGTYFYQHSLHNSLSDISSKGSENYTLQNNETNNELEKEGEINLAAAHVFNKDEEHSISLEAAYSSFNEKEDQHYNQIFNEPKVYTTRSGNLVQKSGNQEELALDYALPINEKSSFESGYSGEFNYQDIRFNDGETLNRFIFYRNIHALYALYGRTLGQFSLKIGLRGEYTNIKAELKSPSDSLFIKNRSNLYPSLHLGYEINDQKEISFSYSKRINRPDADELNPNPEFSGPRNAEAGNVNLKPEQVHSIELGYQSQRENNIFTNSLYYRYTYNAFTSVQQTLNDSIVILTAKNLNTRQALGFESELSGKINKNIDYDLTGDIFYTAIDASKIGYTSKKTSISGSVKAFSGIDFTKTTSLQLNAFYYFKSITPQGNRQPFFYMNAGLKQGLFKGKASLTLTATDIFHTYRIKRIVKTDFLDEISTIQRKVPVILLGFSWRFNGFKTDEKLQYEGQGLKK